MERVREPSSRHNMFRQPGMSTFFAKGAVTTVYRGDTRPVGQWCVGRRVRTRKLWFQVAMIPPTPAIVRKTPARV